MNQAQSDTMPEQNLRFSCTAHHEAGHIAVAAAQGLKLRPEGFAMDILGEGLACYCKKPEDSDLSRERIIIATFAGYKAQTRFCTQRGCLNPDAEREIFSCDWREARDLLSGLSSCYAPLDNIPAIQAGLEVRSGQIVEENWPVIEALAAELMSKEWGPVKPLGSGGIWSTQVIARYVDGVESIHVLKRFGISAMLTADC
jgi:hypothetical protein